MLLLYFDNSLLCRFIAHLSKRWGRWWGFHSLRQLYLSDFRVESSNYLAIMDKTEE